MPHAPLPQGGRRSLINYTATQLSMLSQSDSDVAEPSRLSGRKYALTYSHHCEFSPGDLFHFLQTIKPIKKYIGVTEFHEDNPEFIDEDFAPQGGWPHVHCCVWFNEKLNTSNMSVFDFWDVHPNIKAITSDKMWHDCVNYLLKDPYDVFFFPETWQVPPYKSPQQGSTTKVDIWEALRSCGTNRRQWTQFCHDNKISHPRECFMWKLENDPKKAACTIKARPKLVEEEPATDSAREARRRLWEDEDCGPFDTPDTRNKSVVVVGPSTCGKTTWVLDWCPLPALMCRHIDTLMHFEPGYHKCIIFDDQRFAHMPISNQIMLLDRDHVQQVHVRHWVGIIPAGVLKIFTCANYIPFVNDTQIHARMKLIWLHEGEPEYATASSAVSDFRIG